MGCSMKPIPSRFIISSMLVSYSKRSPGIFRNSSRYFRGMARRPVCVSERRMPNSRRKKREVVRLPATLRGGMPGLLKSRQPRTTQSSFSSIRCPQAMISSVRCCPSPSMVITPRSSGRFSST